MGVGWEDWSGLGWEWVGSAAAAGPAPAERSGDWPGVLVEAALVLSSVLVNLGAGVDEV